MKKIFVLGIIIVFSFFINKELANSYGECDQYGAMSYYDGYSSCKCMSGFSFGKDYSGHKTCISDYQACQNQYGYHATSDYSGSCKCSYGYGFGKNTFGETECVDLDSSCHDQLGYSSSYDSLTDSCKCIYGYIINNGKCVSGNSFCSSSEGIHSSYDTTSKKCSCDTNYTLDKNGQCVEKQNNVYFTLKELDTNNKKAIIKSDYDYCYYLIKYNYGCYDMSFRRYLNHQIVVNLGTDYYLDTWDKIVLKDDDETCDITQKERVDSNFTLIADDEDYSLTLEQINAINNLNKKKVEQSKTILNKPKLDIIEAPEVVPTISKKEKDDLNFEITREVFNPDPVVKIKWYKKIFNWFIGM